MPDRHTTSTAISVSVVIPTLNRESALLNTVDALLSAPSPYFLELIVIDQSDQASSLASCHNEHLIYRRVDFKNLPKARNYGTCLSRGDIVLFLDDDVVCLTHVVEAHALAHIRTCASVVTGPIFAPGEGFRSVDSLCPCQRAKLHTGKLLIFNLDVAYTPLFAPGGNASYRKEVLISLGGFDENFIGSAVGEDAEMSYRVKAMGGKILYDPAASLTHLCVPAGGCRDEADEFKADEARVFNAHYFANKIGRPDLMPKWFLQLLRARAINRRTLKTLQISALASRTYVLMRAWWRARSRTRNLMRDEKSIWRLPRETI